MSVGNIVCRSGVGPKATKALFVTHGLGVGAAVIVTKTGGDDAWYRKKLKEQQVILEVRRQEKLEAAQLLRRQLEEAAYPETEKPISKKEKRIIEGKRAEIPELKIDLELLEKELLLLQREVELQAIEARRLREEDDIQAIMLALNYPFETRH